MVFIRAPKIERVGRVVEVIATEGSDKVPVLVPKGKTMAATFHPELSDDRRIHQYFLDVIENDRPSELSDEQLEVRDWRCRIGAPPAASSSGTARG
jgi:hypothetical protein